MAVILNIETSTQVCSVCISVDGKLKAIRESNIKNAHAESITIFSDEVIKEASLSYADLDAIAVSKGPGSYTGLRIGISTAKGFCYALDKPLIAIETLEAMAWGMNKRVDAEAGLLLCPMIDARRMEVYTSLFDQNLVKVEETQALIIDESSFKKTLSNHKIVFAGDGAGKCKHLLAKNSNVVFLSDFLPSSKNLFPLAEQKFEMNQFEDVAYFEPFYLKDFVAGIPKVKGLK